MSLLTFYDSQFFNHVDLIIFSSKLPLNQLFFILISACLKSIKIMFNLLNIVAKRFSSLERCLQMPSGTWYIISREVQNSYPQYPPNDAQNTPEDSLFRAPPERIFKVWELWKNPPSPKLKRIDEEISAISTSRKHIMLNSEHIQMTDW